MVECEEVIHVAEVRLDEQGDVRRAQTREDVVDRRAGGATAAMPGTDYNFHNAFYMRMSPLGDGNNPTFSLELYDASNGTSQALQHPGWGPHPAFAR